MSIESYLVFALGIIIWGMIVFAVFENVRKRERVFWLILYEHYGENVMRNARTGLYGCAVILYIVPSLYWLLFHIGVEPVILSNVFVIIGGHLVLGFARFYAVTKLNRALFDSESSYHPGKIVYFWMFSNGVDMGPATIADMLGMDVQSVLRAVGYGKSERLTLEMWAHKMGVDRDKLKNIVNGKALVDEDTAKKLKKHTKFSKTFWRGLNLAYLKSYNM